MTSIRDSIQKFMHAYHKLIGDMCDFCGETSALIKEFPCRDFPFAGRIVIELHGQRETINQMMVGSWWACEPCALLISGERFAELADRVYAATEARGGDVPRSYFVDLYREFRKHRKPTVEN